MKLFGEHSISKPLHLIFKYTYYLIGAWVGYLILAHIIGLLGLAFNFSIGIFEINAYEKGYALLLFPETYFKVSSGLWKTPMMMLVFSFYAYLFWQLSALFKHFMANKIFGEPVLKSLSSLAWSLLIASAGLFFFLIGNGLAEGILEISDQDLILTALVFSFSIVLFFINAVFKHGLELQNEQDLTI